jgi:ABC-2 type transport system permease protein
MLALFWRTIKDRRFSIIAYCVAGILLLWLYIALFPAIRDQAQQLSELFKAYPESFMKAFKIEPSQLIFTKLENFLATEQFSIVWPIMLFAMFIAWGGSAIAGEIENDTIELLLAQPISRIKIFFSKYLSGIAALVFFVAVTIFATIPLAAVYNIDFQLSHYFILAIAGLLIGLTVFSISIFFSSLFSEKGRVYFISVGIVVLMYVLNIMSSLKDSLSDLKYFSFFYYFDPMKALVDGKIDNLSFVIFLGLTAIFTILAVILFSKRDISV